MGEIIFHSSSNLGDIENLISFLVEFPLINIIYSEEENGKKDTYKTVNQSGELNRKSSMII